MNTSTNPNALGFLAQGLSAVAPRMEPGKAAAACAQAAGRLTQAMIQTNEPIALRSLSQALSAVAPRMESKEAAAAAKSMEDQTSAMSDMVGQFQVLPEFERGRAQPRTGNPVVDRSLNAGKEKLANVRSAPSRPAPPQRPAAAAGSKPASDYAPVRRRAVGAEDVARDPPHAVREDDVLRGAAEPGERRVREGRPGELGLRAVYHDAGHRRPARRAASLDNL